MEQIVNRLRYDTDTATLLADDHYWDGNNWQRRGRNTFLYVTKKDNYFRYNTSQFEGERDEITPLARAEAMELYEELREHHQDWTEAFKEIVEEA